jgi:hypothetical protein
MCIERALKSKLILRNKFVMQDHSDMHRQCHGRGEKGEHAQEALGGPSNKIADQIILLLW